MILDRIEIADILANQFLVLRSRAILTTLQLNLYESCPFWTENHLCMNPDCGVALVDEVRHSLIVGLVACNSKRLLIRLKS